MVIRFMSSREMCIRDSSALELLGLGHAGHGPLDDHDAAVLGQLSDGHGGIAYGPALELSLIHISVMGMP